MADRFMHCLWVANPCEVGTTFAAPDSRIWGQHFGPTRDECTFISGSHIYLYLSSNTVRGHSNDHYAQAYTQLCTTWHQHSSQKDNKQFQLVSQCTSMASSGSSDDIRYCLIVVDSLLEAAMLLLKQLYYRSPSKKLPHKSFTSTYEFSDTTIC